MNAAIERIRAAGEFLPVRMGLEPPVCGTEPYAWLAAVATERGVTLTACSLDKNHENGCRFQVAAPPAEGAGAEDGGPA